MKRYYNFGGSPRHYAYDWQGLAMPSVRAAETRALGSGYDYEESTAPYDLHFPALADWPPIRPSGPEPGAHDMVGWGRTDLGFFGKLSDNERRLVLLAVAGAGLLWYLRSRRKRRRRNPPRRRYGRTTGKAAVFRKRSRAAKKGWRRRRRGR